MAIITISRVFRFAATDFPDPNPDMNLAQVLEHYGAQYPQLKNGKIVDCGLQGDLHVYEMKKNEFKPNG